MRKKIVIIIGALLLVIGIAGTFWGPSIAQAASSIWNSCPKGRVNCLYPGDCRDYIDTNKDGICDRSQPAPAAVAAPKNTSASTTTAAPKTTAASPSLISGALVDSSISSGTSGAASSASAVISGAADTDVTAGTGNAIGRGTIYYFIPVMAGFIAAYCLTWILSAKKVFKTLTHRKIWNLILLISALVSILLGLILTLNIDFNTGISLPFNMIFWHVEAGIAMSVVAIFHVVWHWRYFVKILKVTGQAN
jgi:hypothetical protein